jgi:hypothetical protein
MERLVPKLLTVPEVAKILRTTAKAVLVDWIDEGRAPSAEGGSGR